MTPSPAYCNVHRLDATWTDDKGRPHCPECDKERFVARHRHLILAPIYAPVAGRTPSWLR